MLEIRWHGRAGQGAKTTAHMLALALAEAGKWVQAFPEYGPERSGSPMRAYNRSDSAPIRRRHGVSAPDAVAVLDHSLIREVDVLEGLGAGGLLVLNTDEDEPVVRQRLGYEGRLVCVPGDRIASAAGTRHPNVVLLGALAAALGEPPLTALLHAAETALGGKLTPEALQSTRAAMEHGFEIGAHGVTTGSGHETPRMRAVLAPKRYPELPSAAAIISADAERMRTAGWRSGTKPSVDLSRCVNCLLCWVYCPDCALVVAHDRLLGVDYELCKACELCVEVCPVRAITMVDETELGVAPNRVSDPAIRGSRP